MTRLETQHEHRGTILAALAIGAIVVLFLLRLDVLKLDSGAPVG